MGPAFIEAQAFKPEGDFGVGFPGPPPGDIGNQVGQQIVPERNLPIKEENIDQDPPRLEAETLIAAPKEGKRAPVGLVCVDMRVSARQGDLVVIYSKALHQGTGSDPGGMQQEEEHRGLELLHIGLDHRGRLLFVG